MNSLNSSAATSAPLPSQWASNAPEHAAVGVDDKELAEIVTEFSAAVEALVPDSEREHFLFQPPCPGDVIRLPEKARVYHQKHGWMTPAEARAQIERWREHARAQGLRSQGNAGRVVLSLFDTSGSWSRPWEEAGYQVYRFDIQDNPETGDVNEFGVGFFGDWFADFFGVDVYAVLAACPCTDFASSGARHFAAKDADGRTVASVRLVHQTLRAVEYFRPAIWAIENPVGRIERLGGLPPWRLAFNPCDLGETYTKKTLIWGRFNADLPVAPVEPVEGSKMHRMYGGSSLATKNARSVTPVGFAYAFFMANNAEDHPAMALAGKYDRLCPRLLGEAVSAGLSAEVVAGLVDDDYYDLNDSAAEAALQVALAGCGVDLDKYQQTDGQLAMWI